MNEKLTRGVSRVIVAFLTLEVDDVHLDKCKAPASIIVLYLF